MTNLTDNPLLLTESDVVKLVSSLSPRAFASAVIGRARSRVEVFSAVLILVESYDELF